MDSSEYNKGINDAQSKASGLGSKLKSGLGTAGSIAAKGLGLVVTAAGAVGGALLALEASTEEYRVAQGKLNTAFEAAGMSAQAAETAYNGFYGILGDTDTATEASQLLAKLAQSEQDLTKWTDIAAGVYGTFGDALPIEGLIEAANETAKVGQVTGNLADALNWAGISEDEFNAQLAACGSEAERNQLIMETLSGTYDEASDAFYRNNEALVQAREAQAQMDASLAQLGTQVTNIKNKLIGEFLPAISQITTGLASMLQGTGGSEQITAGITSLVTKLAESLPQFLNFGMQILSAIGQGILNAMPTIISSGIQIVTQVGQSIISALPSVLSAGGQIILQIAQGIVTYLPQLIAVLPQIITSIINYLTENFPTILQKGTELLVQLATGIIQAIPQLVAQLPQIITAIVNFIAQNLPTLLAQGVTMLLKIAAGIVRSIPQLVAVLPQLIAAIVSGIAALLGSLIESGKSMVNAVGQGVKSLVSSALQWGKDLIQNFIDGIKAKFSALKSKVTSIASTVKDLIGFSEPKEGPLSNFHTYAPDMIDLFTQGIDQNKGKIRNAMIDALDFQNDMSFSTARVGFERSGLGISSAGIINSIPSQSSGGIYTFNLVLPDGTKIATYMFNPLINYARANGTPILNPVRK